LTDFREDALWHLIDSLDTQAFQGLAGPTTADLHRLPGMGVFNDHHMDESIWQCRLFERASLEYFDATASTRTINVGRRNSTVTVSR